MFVGFFLPQRAKLNHYAEQGLNGLVFIILMVIGAELGLIGDIGQRLGDIVLYVLLLMALTLSFGTLGLWIFAKWQTFPYQVHGYHENKNSVSLAGSLIQIGCLAVGFAIAKILPADFVMPDYVITVLLMVLLLLVGICLRASGVSLKQALINKYGLQMSLVFMVFTLMGGAVFALMTDVPISQGLAMASGFGWYSLSGTVMTDAYGAVWGSVALFNDLGRELVALLFIPYVMRHSPTSAIGLGGVTSLDFTLPTLTGSGGIQITPLVISFGFITNVVSPVLMVGFSAL
jgi:uncharacterized membrane protein YbjE (DUF340 family)